MFAGLFRLETVNCLDLNLFFHITFYLVVTNFSLDLVVNIS